MPKRTTRIGKWYKADDENVHFVRRRKVFIIYSKKGS